MVFGLSAKGCKVQFRPLQACGSHTRRDRMAYSGKITGPGKNNRAKWIL
jgi:hypothetical protein